MHLITGPIPADIPAAQEPTGLPAAVAAIYPMTRAQEGLWLAYSAAPWHTLYNLTMRMSFKTNSELHFLDVDGTHVRAVIDVLTARHGILRSTFHEDRSVHPRPFIAEWERTSARASVQVVFTASTDLKDGGLETMLHSAINLSSEFPVRWLVRVGDAEIDVFLVANHIALDGMSMSIVSTEFFTLLSDPTHAERSSIASNRFHEAHMLEAAYRTSPAFKMARDFWLGQCRLVSPIRWKEAPQKARLINYREIDDCFNLTKEKLTRLGTRYNTSWFRVAVAVIGLLVRTSAEPTQEDHAMLVAFGGRPESMQGTVGHFANALPIRIPLTQVLRSANPTFDALLQVVSTTISSGKKHDRFSFADLCRAQNVAGLQMPRFQVAITLSPQLARPECTLYPVEGAYDLFFCFLEEKDTVSIGLIYDPLLFSTAAIASFKSDFRRLMQLVMEETPMDLSSFPSLIAHIPRLLSGLDITDSRQISATPFHSMFEHQAAKNSVAIALSSAEQHKSLTYGQLNHKANQLAHLLRKSKVQRHKVVLLHLDRGFDLMGWILAVLKSGAAYVVGDPSHPSERTRSVISVSQPDLIIQDGAGDDISDLASSAHIPVIDARTIDLQDVPTGNIEQVSQPGDLAYIVFTSGSTGQPKGVEIEHSNLSHLVASVYSSGYFPVVPGSRVLQFAAFTFDAAIFEWAICLAHGGTLCFAETPQALVGDYLADVIETNRISHVHLTPSVLSSLPTDRKLPSLSQISLGGEMAPDSLIETWRAITNVENGYGPSECTVVVTHQSYSRDKQVAQPSAAIVGKPHAHTTLYVCSEAFDRVLSVGEPGEICIGGPQVGRGYRNRPDLTDRRFAFHPQIGQRLYRTGDRGKILSDESVLLLGRMDREVKVRGYRINLEDVERAVLDLMADIVSVSAQIHSAGTSLCVFVSPESVDGDNLKRQLRAILPHYMVPSAVYCLSHLQLNSNGKTDHTFIRNNMDHLITTVKQGKRFRQSSSILPLTPLSSKAPSPVHGEPSLIKTISVIWTALLDLDELPRADSNFFELGGNSILAQQLTERLKIMFSPLASMLSVVDIFKAPTLSGLAFLLDSKISGRGEPQKHPSPMEDLKVEMHSSTNVGRDIAIVGISGRFPGASNPDELYQLLLDRREAFYSFPNAAGEPANLPGAQYVPTRGALPDLDHFDWQRWGIKEEEAKHMDRQTWLFITVAQEALEDADYEVATAGFNKVGLYVGATNEPRHFTDEASDEPLRPSISAQAAYYLNLQGPNVSLSAACSSGMVGMNLAVDHLRSKRCDCAVVGGVSIGPQWVLHCVLYSELDEGICRGGYFTTEHQPYSRSGHCRPFDHRANGTVPGDAVCALVLRRLDDAIAAGDAIYAVISGIAGGSDGNVGKASLTSPSPWGHVQTMKHAWEDAGLRPEQLTYAELHGSGTPIGDALELEAMNLARVELGAGDITYGAGSNKGNIGNCEAASGLISVIKLCKSIQHGFIPPLQSFEAPNPIINSRLPVKFAAEGVPISAEAILSASSSGFGGINVHCIMRFPPPNHGQN
ncbi:hypothetical protein B0H19DRAFT_1020850 [Mycena capillaripes]|nr:hypothetical protein B0H19DRAFT_1020850 [Mycena capillaripes]